MSFNRFRNSALLSMMLLFAIAPAAWAADDWALLHTGQRGDSDVYYDRQSVRQINDRIMEVYIKVVHAENRHSVQQMRIDCSNQKLAKGLNAVYANGSRTERMDFSKPDWVWFPPMNAADKKLLNLACGRAG